MTDERDAGENYVIRLSKRSAETMIRTGKLRALMLMNARILLAA